ncbi:MAG: hypothetical protein NVS4B12_14030 [Ktedonobacteraceae bacterium]
MSSAGSFELAPASYVHKLAYNTASFTAQPYAFDQHGNWYRLLDIEGVLVSIKVTASGTISWTSSDAVKNADVQRSVGRLFSLVPLPQEAAAHLSTPLAQHFLDLAPLVHIASPTLGEALIKGIIRQVISAAQARKILHQFVTRYGVSYQHENLTSYNFPTLEAIIQQPLEELSACGLGFKAKIVQYVAHQLLEENIEEQVRQCSSSDAVLLLQRLKWIGNWTAHIAVSDFLHDYSQYPFSDLAVRKWAKLLWQEGDWPNDEATFGQAWKRINGEHTGLITFYLLALGKQLNI